MHSLTLPSSQTAILRFPGICRVNLDKIYAEGGRKFVVWGFVAIDQVPLVQILNKYVNVLDQVFTRTSNDSALQYSRKVEVGKAPFENVCIPADLSTSNKALQSSSTATDADCEQPSPIWHAME